MRKLARLARDTRGATAIEYGLICGAIAMALVASLSNVSSGFGSVFGRVGSSFTS